MAENVKPIPEGYTSATPYYITKDTAALLKFLEDGLGAKVLARIPGPEGKGIAHAEAEIGNAKLMFSDASEMAPATRTNTYVYVDDPDAVVKKAEAAGGKVLQPVSDQFWGDRWGLVEDPLGNHWQIARHVKDIKFEDIEMPGQTASSATR